MSLKRMTTKRLRQIGGWLEAADTKILCVSMEWDQVVDILDPPDDEEDFGDDYKDDDHD
jgi:hypothetical protein